MANFYADENVPNNLISALRVLGNDVLTAYEAGKANMAIRDEDVLAFAQSLNRIVITFNRRDFLRLHKSKGGRHAGIVTCTIDSDIPGLAQRIHEAVCREKETISCFVRVTRPK